MRRPGLVRASRLLRGLQLPLLQSPLHRLWRHRPQDRAGAMIAGPWSTREEFETWWRANVIALNRLSVSDPREYERVVRVIEKFNAQHPR